MKIEGFNGQILEKEKLKYHCTWKVGGVADYLVIPKDVFDIERVVSYCIKNSLFYYVIGNGSNILFPDEGIQGVVIKIANSLKEKVIVKYGKEFSNVYFGAGNYANEAISFTIKAGMSGLEFLAGIPASFGGILKMNAGAFNTEIMQLVEFINIYSYQNGFMTIGKQDLDYAYRRLSLPKDSVILGGMVKLMNSTAKAVQEKVLANHEKRRATQPLNANTCGSVFKNPSGDYAGRIIEELGLKGFQVGGAKISEKHANFIENTGNASAKDMLTLIEMIKQKVWLKKQLVLEEEVVIINKNKGSKVSII